MNTIIKTTTPIESPPTHPIPPSFTQPLSQPNQTITPNPTLIVPPRHLSLLTSPTLHTPSFPPALLTPSPPPAIHAPSLPRTLIAASLRSAAPRTPPPLPLTPPLPLPLPLLNTQHQPRSQYRKRASPIPTSDPTTPTASAFAPDTSPP
ncbi:hypothetical protein CVT24_010103 [Panaeolus cyanescens]|uniref:Uncharacterized protein n=1 Tax=Panaeolus cyanescens TaxID=181874 RepID=A0A409W9F1_9AGAR|nr:hypothetical protein CVT24_010103 [Panaeolus cyanescens]